MAKLAITIFAVLLLVANAYAHRTTITTIEIDEDAMRQNKAKCQQQIEETDLSHCERYITQSRGQQEIAMVSAESLPQCCSQMYQLDDKCMCKALKQILEEGQQQGGSTEGQEQQQMIERAQTVVIYCRLPARCKWESEDAMRQTKGKCQRQIEETDLSHCERFITQSRGQQEIAMVSDKANQSAQSPKRCCSQVQRLDDKCICKALKQIVEEGQEQGGSMEGQEQQQMMRKRAQTVVTYCRLPQRCQWGSAWF